MITLSKHYCPDCFDNCWFAYDAATGQHTHVDDYAAYTASLVAAGYYYASHSGGVYHYRPSFRLADVTPLTLDWQIAAEIHQAPAVLEPDF